MSEVRPYSPEITPDTGIEVVQHEGSLIALLAPEAAREHFRLPESWTNDLLNILQELGTMHPFDFGQPNTDLTCREDEFDGVLQQFKVYGRDLLVHPSTQWLSEAYSGHILSFLRQFDPSVVDAYRQQNSFAHLIQTMEGSRGERHIDVSDVNVNLYIASEDMDGGDLLFWIDPNQQNPEQQIERTMRIPVVNGSASENKKKPDSALRLTHGVDWVRQGLRAAINMNYEMLENADRDRSSIDIWDGNTP